MSSIDSLVMVTSTPVALLNAAMLAFVAWSSASRNFPQRRNCSFAPGSGLKGCSWAHAVAQPVRFAANAPPASAAFIISRLVRMTFLLGSFRLLTARHLFQRRSPDACDPGDREAAPHDMHFLIPALLRSVIILSILHTRSSGGQSRH